MSKGDDTKYKNEQKTANGVVKLASLLQKALETGRTNNVEMSEVSKYLNYYVKTQLDDSCMYLDYIIYSKSEERFKQLKSELVKIFDDINEILADGYEKLVAPNGSVDRNLFERLIQIDTDITIVSNMIRNVLGNVKDSGEITKQEIKEMSDMIDELAVHVNERKKILK
jgi:hypothetical protein